MNPARIARNSRICTVQPVGGWVGLNGWYTDLLGHTHEGAEMSELPTSEVNLMRKLLVKLVRADIGKREQRIIELEAEVEKEQRHRKQAEEACQAKEMNVPIGPLVGAHTIMNQACYIKQLEAQNERLRQTIHQLRESRDTLMGQCETLEAGIREVLVMHDHSMVTLTAVRAHLRKLVEEKES